MIDLDLFVHQVEVCKYDHEQLAISNSGVAYRKTTNERIYCFMDVDLERGRGEEVECIRKECRHYIFKIPILKTLPEYFFTARTQFIRSKDNI